MLSNEEHIMADLPRERFDGSHAFQATGTDFCGSILFKSEVRISYSFGFPRMLLISRFVPLDSAAVKIAKHNFYHAIGFWARWKEEYLTLLRRTPKPVDDLVLVHTLYLQ